MMMLLNLLSVRIRPVRGPELIIRPRPVDFSAGSFDKIPGRPFPRPGLARFAGFLLLFPEQRVPDLIYYGMNIKAQKCGCGTNNLVFEILNSERSLGLIRPGLRDTLCELFFFFLVYISSH